MMTVAWCAMKSAAETEMLLEASEGSGLASPNAWERYAITWSGASLSKRPRSDVMTSSGYGDSGSRITGGIDAKPGDRDT